MEKITNIDNEMLSFYYYKELSEIFTKSNLKPIEDKLIEKFKNLSLFNIYEEISKSKQKWIGEIYEVFYDANQEDIKTEKDLNLRAVSGLIFYQMYKLLNDDFFKITKVRLCKLPIINEFSKESPLAKYYFNLNIKKFFRIMSKYVDGYKDLSTLKVRDIKEKNKVINFIEYIKKYRRIPEKVIIPECKKEVKLKGLIELLAVSSSLNNICEIGNAGIGYTVQNNENEKNVQVIVVKINSGYSLKYENLSKKKDITLTIKDNIAKDKKVTIKLENLTKSQKEAFLEVKRQNLKIIENTNLQDIFKDIFDENPALPKEIVSKLMEKFVNHIKSQEIIYEKELKEYELKRTDKLVNHFEEKGNIEYKNKNYYQAWLYYKKNLEIKIEKYGKNAIKVGESYTLIAKAEFNIKHYKKCIKNYLLGLNILKKHYPENDLIKYINDLGNIYYHIAEYDKALEYHEKTLKIQKEIVKTNDNLNIAITYNYLGNAYYNKKEYDKAIKYYEKSLVEIQKKNLPKNHTDIATIYSNLENTYCDMGNAYHDEKKYDKAIEYYKKSLEIQKKILPKNHPDIAINYTNLGHAHLHNGECDKAIESYKESLEIQKKILPKNHPDIAINYTNLGRAHLHNGEYDEAIESYKESLEIQKTISQTDYDIHFHLYESYDNLGTVYNKKYEEKNDKVDYYIALEFFKKRDEEMSKTKLYKMVTPTIQYINDIGFRQWLKSKKSFKNNFYKN